MEPVIKAVLTAIAAGILIIILNQSRPEYAFFVRIAALTAVFALCMQILSALIGYAENLIPGYDRQNDFVSILIKALIIALISKAGADICRDSGGNALAFAVETTGNAMILLVCMPLFGTITRIISDLLKG